MIAAPAQCHVEGIAERSHEAGRLEVFPETITISYLCRSESQYLKLCCGGMQVQDTLISYSSVNQLTLNALVGILLKYAEAEFGARIQDHLFLGVEFADRGHPMTQYGAPYLNGIGAANSAIIQLGVQAQNDVDEARYQLSQEIVPLLFPPVQYASVLEKGLAQVFAEKACIKFGWGYKGCYGDYLPAKQRVEELLALDKDAIQKLRAVKNALGDLDANELIATLPAIDPQLASDLTKRFHGHGLTVRP